MRVKEGVYAYSEPCRTRSVFEDGAFCEDS